MSTQVYNATGGGLTGLTPKPIIAQRDPVSTDKVSPSGAPYEIMQGWNNELTDDTFIYLGEGNWVEIATIAGTVTALAGDSGTALPAAGIITVAGGTNITTAGSGSTLTANLDATLTGLTSVTSGTFVTSSATTGTTYTANTITATGSDANINIGIVPKGTGAAAVTGPLTASTTITAGTGITATTGNIVATAGAVNSGTTMTAGTGLIVTTGGVTVNGGDIINSHSNAGTDVTIEVTNSDNTNGASRAGVEIATGGASSGDPYLSFQISGVAASTMSMGLDNSASDLFVISNNTALGTSNALTLSQAGALNATTSITAGTTLTATLGAITATNGNLVLNTAGNKIVSTSVGSTSTAGANSFGTVTLVNGTVTVSTTAVTASSIIILTRQSVGTTGANDLGILSVGTIVAATSFDINAWTVTNATALQADDQSVIGWMIIN